MSESPQLLKALAVLCQIYNRQVSTSDAQDLAREYAADLASYPEHSVLEAIRRCRRELRTFPTIADIIARIDDGRPGPEEAWAMIPVDEYGSVVWTQEMQEAFGVARRFLPEDPEERDEIAARMAFKEKYTKLVVEARASGVPARWEPSLGSDPRMREAALGDAVRKGRLTAAHAQALLPNYAGHAGKAAALIDGPAEEPISPLEGVAQVLKVLGADPLPKPMPLGPVQREEDVARAELRRAELKRQADLIREAERKEGA